MCTNFWENTSQRDAFGLFFNGPSLECWFKYASSYPCVELCLTRLHLKLGYIHRHSGPLRIRQPLQLDRRLI